MQSNKLIIKLGGAKNLYIPKTYPSNIFPVNLERYNQGDLADSLCVLSLCVLND